MHTRCQRWALQLLQVINTQGSVMDLSLTGISPGEVMVMGTATAQGMLDYTFMMDFDLEKENKPPTISIETIYKVKKQNGNSMA